MGKTASKKTATAKRTKKKTAGRAGPIKGPHSKSGAFRGSRTALATATAVSPSVYPQPGDNVSSPFPAYGRLDPGAIDANVTFTSDTQSLPPFNGQRVDPPRSGYNWEYRFNLPQDDYTMVVDEGVAVYRHDPVHVI
jgi:hypothetical protein